MNAHKLEQWAFRIGAVLMGFVVLVVFLPAAKPYPRLIMHLLGPTFVFAGYWMSSRGLRIVRTGRLVVTSLFSETEVPSFLARFYGLSQLLMGGLALLLGVGLSVASFF